WLMEAVEDSVVFQRKLWTDAVEEALREVRKAGVEVIIPDKSPFREAVRSMHESFRETPLYDLIRAIEQVGND
ncbi:MAG: TRAP transporter substrate-binding protein, partial [Candidatus Aminicenantes bacterium]|nr:TRAP transporter substrate-binding protein [Candidatus Aminicenantes bacterium]